MSSIEAAHKVRGEKKWRRQIVKWSHQLTDAIRYYGPVKTNLFVTHEQRRRQLMKPDVYQLLLTGLIYWPHTALLHVHREKMYFVFKKM